MHAGKSINLGRTIVGTAATLAAAATLILAPSASPASAAETKNCRGGSSHQNFANVTNRVMEGQPVRSGIFGGCTVRWRGSAQVNLDCYWTNHYGSKFWFVHANDGRQGWVFEGNFADTAPSGYQCQNHRMTLAEYNAIED